MTGVNRLDDFFLIRPHDWSIGLSDIQVHESLRHAYGWESEFEGLVDDIHPLKAIAHSDIGCDPLRVCPWTVWLVSLGAMGWGSVTARNHKRETAVCSQLVQSMDQLWLDFIAARFRTRELGLVEELIHLFFP